MEEILDMISEVLGAIFFITFFLSFVLWGGRFSAADLVQKLAAMVLGEQIWTE